MSKHTTLEDAVFAREIATISHRVGEHVEAIREIFREYLEDGKVPHGGEDPDFSQLRQWLNKLPILGQVYYAGYYAYITHPDYRKMPKALEDAVKAKALAEFLSKVESIEEVRSIAENASYAANQ